MVDPSAILADPFAHLAEDDERDRRLAVSMCAGAREPATFQALGRILESDPSSRVRAEAAEVLATLPGMETDAESMLLSRRTDEQDPIVTEAIVTALGELGSRAALEWLVEIVEAGAGSHDKLIVEAAVAGLGAIGHPDALPALVASAATGPPQVRRRAVVALTAFDVPEAEHAIRAARDDRNPMVREVAEMIVGRAIPEWTPVDGPGPPDQN